MKSKTYFEAFSYIQSPMTGALTVHNNGDHDHLSRYKSFYQKDELGKIGQIHYA